MSEVSRLHSQPAWVVRAEPANGGVVPDLLRVAPATPTPSVVPARRQLLAPASSLAVRRSRGQAFLLAQATDQTGALVPVIAYLIAGAGEGSVGAPINNAAIKGTPPERSSVAADAGSTNVAP